MTTLVRRLQALVLFLLFLGGGTTLPSADILLHHLNGQPLHTESHIESAAGCANHAGHCGVGYPATASGALGTFRNGISIEVVVTKTTQYSSIHSLVQIGRRTGFHSRAPPTFSS